MAAVALSILGKSNEPLYIREFRSGGVSAARVSDEELFGLPPPVPYDDGGSSRKLDRTVAANNLATTSEAGAIDCSVQLQFVLHAALDRFDELAGSSGYAWRAPGDTGTDAMFVGLLKPVDNFRVYGAYPTPSRDTDPTERFLMSTCSFVSFFDRTADSGYMTTTQIRFVLVVEDHHAASSSAAAPWRDQRSVDDAIYRLFVKLHRLYVEHTLNPFAALSGPIQSPKLDRKVHECVTAFNRSISE
jgi:Sedlin, N-terminal conserved region